jgi:hypothetical protein
MENSGIFDSSIILILKSSGKFFKIGEKVRFSEGKDLVKYFEEIFNIEFSEKIPKT